MYALSLVRYTFTSPATLSCASLGLSDLRIQTERERSWTISWSGNGTVGGIRRTLATKSRKGGAGDLTKSN